MKLGIAPALVVSQVKNTAAWLWKDARLEAAQNILDDLAGAEASQRSEDGSRYLAVLLAAHFATVATFVPTDVDTRIRHHAWAAMTRPEALAPACKVIDEVATWDVHAVSARVVDDPKHGPLSGHDGEWLAVRAGAAGRAGALGAKDVLEQLAAQIDAELAREEALFVEAFEKTADAAASERTLRIATIVAHNLGDLSRVVAEWPKVEQSGLGPYRDRWVRLAHPDSVATRAAFVAAGNLNKALMAIENHRFLPLRGPRALRESRDLLLPIGPWFDSWGQTIATHPALEQCDRADVLAGLLEIHGRDPAQEGCLRAISGMHRATRGGIELFVPDLPARMRKDATRGKVRDVLDVTADHFATRFDRRCRAERDRAWPVSARRR